MNINYKNHTIKIVKDEDPQSPRENYNTSKFYFFGGMKGYGDKHDLPDPRSLGISTVAEHADWFKRNFGGVIVPVYGYSHSGVSLSTQPFSCKFDSGCAGFAVISWKDITKCFNLDQETLESITEKCTKEIGGEVETMNKYLNGEFYGFQISDKSGEEVDACYGYDDADYALEQAKESVDAIEKANSINKPVQSIEKLAPSINTKPPMPPMNIEGMKIVSLDELTKNPQGQQILEYLHKIMGLQVPQHPSATPPKPCGCIPKPTTPPVTPQKTPTPPVPQKPAVESLDSLVGRLMTNPKTGKRFKKSELKTNQISKITAEVAKRLVSLAE